MNTSHVFRSHLMQQFVAAARTQSRPPLALFGVTGDEDGNKEWRSDASPLHRPSSSQLRNQRASVNQRSPVISGTTWIPHTPHSIDPPFQDHGILSTASSQASVSDYSSVQLQEFLQSRRSASRFVAPSREYPWKDALGRAVECGLRAPRSEAVRFKRLVAPSDATLRLAEITFQVDRRKGKSEEEAERKRQKWQQIPAFLVTLVEDPESITAAHDNKDCDPYHPIPYVPPSTERALADYAYASAALQNVLLSLHSEGIASKWTTGDVVHTPAFRELVLAQPEDRVVGLVMVGHASNSASRNSRRRRSVANLLEDI